MSDKKLSKKQMEQVLEWMKKNRHRYRKPSAKRLYARVLGYYRSFTKGRLNDRQAKRLARDLIALAILTAAMAEIFLSKNKVVTNTLLAIAAAADKNVESLGYKMAKILQTIFKHGPTIIHIAKRTASLVKRTYHKVIRGGRKVLGKIKNWFLNLWGRNSGFAWA